MSDSKKQTCDVVQLQHNADSNRFFFSDEMSRSCDLSEVMNYIKCTHIIHMWIYGTLICKSKSAKHLIFRVRGLHLLSWRVKLLVNPLKNGYCVSFAVWKLFRKSIIVIIKTTVHTLDCYELIKSICASSFASDNYKQSDVSSNEIFYICY